MYNEFESSTIATYSSTKCNSIIFINHLSHPFPKVWHGSGDCVYKGKAQQVYFSTNNDFSLNGNVFVLLFSKYLLYLSLLINSQSTS